MNIEISPDELTAKPSVREKFFPPVKPLWHVSSGLAKKIIEESEPTPLAIDAFFKICSVDAPIRKQPSMHKIHIATALYYGYKEDQISGAQRFAPLVRVRQIFFFLAHQLSGQSLIQIGRFTGGRDHTTVLHGTRKIQAILLQYDEQKHLSREIEEITALINWKPDASDPNQFPLPFAEAAE